MRYFDFIKEIKEISTSHILVNEYGEGDIYEYLNNGEHKYPCIFLTVTNLNTTDSGTTINFTLFYTDRLVENQANKTAIQSTGISVIKQILSRYEQLHPEYLLNSVNYTPFTEKFTDMCAGVFCDVVIENQIDTLEDYDNECEEGAFAVKTITLTKNGIYDIVGYDSAVVDVKPEIQKMKVRTLTVTNNCIVDGRWNGEYLLDTSEMTSFDGMFWVCTSLQSLDLSGWDTSNVTNMGDMFFTCNALQSVGDLSSWDTSNVTNMDSMFSRCRTLQTLDVSNWDTSNVTDMSDLFNECTSLKTLDLSSWDTSNVTNMGGMFAQCTSLIELDLTGWDTSNVIYNTFIFSLCEKLKSLIGSKTIDEVITDNIYTFNELKISIDIHYSILDRPSLRALINGIADLSDTSSKTILLSYYSRSKLTEEDIAIATAKNWTIA